MERTPVVAVAEDDPDVRALLALALEDDFEVSVHETGTDCWERLRREPRPDVVVLDLTLPGLDGLEVLERVRADEALATTPVVFLTGHDRSALAGTDPELTHYVGKPFSPTALRERLQELAADGDPGRRSSR